MKPVAIYVRSSQDLHQVSCKAQEEHIRRVVKDNGEEVFRVFCDEALSSTRDVRPEFDEMVSLSFSKNPPFGKIYCLDTSRFGRDQYQTQALLYQLRKKHGLEVIFVNMPQTGSYLDPVFETIMSAFDQLHSQQSKVKGVASMKQNVRQGYRAGGRAPYGYRLKEVEIGQHRHGTTVTKTILEPDPETAPIIKEYFERRVRGETKMSILDDFYRRGIPSPSGQRKWGTPSLKAIEDNIDVYLGHTVFNRHNERIKERGKFCGYLHGKKWRPREEWVITENTHEPLITQEIADKIEDMRARGFRDAPITAKRVYALSGIMKCSLCGTNYTGDRGIYRCNSMTKPGDRCTNNDISQKKVEEALFSLLTQHVLNFKNIQDFFDRVKKRFRNDHAEIRRIETRLAQLDRRIHRIIDLYSEGAIEQDEMRVAMEPLRKQKAAISEHLEKVMSAGEVLDVSDEEIMDVIENFTEEIHQADPKIRKSAVQALFHEIRIFPKEGSRWERFLEIKGIYLPLTRYKLASPTGFEPVLPA